MIVSARPREALDALIWRVFGRVAGIEERVLDASPGLADIAHALPAGHPVTLPDIDPGPAELPLVQLWD